MKVAISAANPSLDALIDPRFGRCQYFIIIDTDTMTVDTFPNAIKAAISGAGISAAQVLVNKDVQSVITGRVGPNALDVLSSVGIEILTGASGTVREALEQFTSGQLQPTTANQVPVRGYGIGRGRGMGRGRVGGFRRWQTPGQQGSMAQRSSQMHGTGTSKEQEIQLLETQAQQIQLQLIQLRKRLNNLKQEKRTRE